ncbi:hypothetical protein E2C01_037454 [Portunus trituberculatus]|uniref:Uncharacterized protein n=1 Tax=Portunus trituberculatus TaxID=210409 RepID=A0A5B7F9E4_PORTR|nr:hypothetical protein [Portunus trituberculatus]
MNQSGMPLPDLTQGKSAPKHHLSVVLGSLNQGMRSCGTFLSLSVIEDMPKSVWREATEE